jgi:hypothetical protein
MPPGPVVCLTCRQRVAYQRGICELCRRRHSRAVRAGKTTWAELEAAGLALPAQRRGGKA